MTRSASFQSADPELETCGIGLPTQESREEGEDHTIAILSRVKESINNVPERRATSPKRHPRVQTDLVRRPSEQVRVERRNPGCFVIHGDERSPDLLSLSVAAVGPRRKELAGISR